MAIGRHRGPAQHRGGYGGGSARAAAFAVVAGFMLRKRAAGATAAATNAQLTPTGPQYDPASGLYGATANGGFDPGALTSGVPSSLAGYGGYGVTAGTPPVDLTPS